jgi:hypothetical protein
MFARLLLPDGIIVAHADALRTWLLLFGRLCASDGDGQVSGWILLLVGLVGVSEQCDRMRGWVLLSVGLVVADAVHLPTRFVLRTWSDPVASAAMPSWSLLPDQIVVWAGQWHLRGWLLLPYRLLVGTADCMSRRFVLCGRPHFGAAAVLHCRSLLPRWQYIEHGRRLV